MQALKNAVSLLIFEYVHTSNVTMCFYVLIFEYVYASEMNVKGLLYADF